ncbi:GntR family transcriptional regulator [Paratractidigestivibacter sp.]|uniref:GntR family transcriptional regulator n=1 Tax=Paratractidigestivibacter sp. TaxID=2847316 RepID=UPI002ABD53E7|nr:GntR family transcriptional regulator [Paratractidigestivibacter sp.]
MDMLQTLASEPLDPEGSAPLYQQLKDRVLQLIATRAFDDSTPLPREQDIADTLGLSRGTVRRCFQDLVDDGTIIRRRGRGTFVNYRRDAHTLGAAFNFTAEISALGKVPSSRVISLRKRAAKGGVAKRLSIPEGTEVWEIRRVRYADENPMQYVTAFVPVTVCPELTKEALTASLYTIIATASGRMPARATEVYEAVNLDGAEARALGLEPGCAALRVLRTTFDQHMRPFEASVIVMRGDRDRFMLTLDTAGTTFSKVTS